MPGANGRRLGLLTLATERWLCELRFFLNNIAVNSFVAKRSDYVKMWQLC